MLLFVVFKLVLGAGPRTCRPSPYRGGARPWASCTSSPAGGCSVWFALTWLLTKVLRLTGTEALYFRITFMVLGVIAVAGVVWYFCKRKKAERATGAGAADAEPGSGDEIDVLIRDAEARLAASGQSGKIGTLPVIFVVGEPGTTKTSTVVHSGLEPELLAGQVYQNNVIAPPARPTCGSRARPCWWRRAASC